MAKKNKQPKDLEEKQLQEVETQEETETSNEVTAESPKASKKAEKQAKKAEKQAEKEEKAIKAEKAKAKSNKQKKEKKSLKKRATEVWSELKKVSKPSFGKVVKNTCVVIAVVAICTVLLFGIDRLFSLVYNLLLPKM